MKKIISLVLVLVLALTAIGGTLAYFTDTDKATNVFTVNNVSIDLHEANKEETPATDEAYHEWLKDQELLPGDNETNTIAKRVYVENDGTTDAYVRVHIAIPSVLDDAQPNFDASENLLHFNAANETLVAGKWNWGTKVVEGREAGKFFGAGDNFNFYTANIDDIDYNVYVVTYETALAPKAITEDAIHQVYLYHDVTNEDIKKASDVIGSKWNVLVFAEGGQTGEEWDNAFDALNKQFGVPSTANCPWNK